MGCAETDGCRGKLFSLRKQGQLEAEGLHLFQHDTSVGLEVKAGHLSAKAMLEHVLPHC